MDERAALELVCAWLDDGALLTAGRVCRAWCDVATAGHLWGHRLPAVAWARGRDPRQACGMVLRARRRWATRCWRTHTLTRHAARTGVVDGDWLAYETAAPAHGTNGYRCDDSDSDTDDSDTGDGNSNSGGSGDRRKRASDRRVLLYDLAHQRHVASLRYATPVGPRGPASDCLS